MTQSDLSFDQILAMLNRLVRTESPERYLSPPAPGTLEWLSVHPSYLKWLLGDGGILGLRGNPGTGKTTAMTYLLQESRREENETHINLAFFFQGLGLRTRYDMYSSLLYDLLSRASGFGMPLWEKTDDWIIRASVDDLRELFLCVLLEACKVTRIRIFLDALDEAGHEEARKVIADLRRITSEVERVATGLAFCFSCRNYSVFTVDNGLEIKIGKHNEEDIKHYVDFRLRKQMRASQVQAPHECLERFSSIVTEKAKNSFIIAVLMTETTKKLLKKHSTETAIIHQLSKPPESLGNLYRNILRGNIHRGGNGPTITMALIQWLRSSIRPMSVEELRCGLISDERFSPLEDGPVAILTDEVWMTSVLRSCLSDLIQIEDVTDQTGTIKSLVRFIHFSVAEWCGRPGEMAAIFNVDASKWVGMGHDRISRACYHFIRANNMKWDEPSSQESSGRHFRDYAISYWFDHAAMAEAEGFSQSYLREQLAGHMGSMLLAQWAKDYGRQRLARHSLTMAPSVCDIAVAFNIVSCMY